RASLAGWADPASPASRDRLRFELAIRFEGFGRGVEDQARRMIALAAELTGSGTHRGAGGDAGSAADLAGIEIARLDEAAATALRRRHDAVRAAPLRVRLTGLPSRFPAIAALAAPLGAIAWYPTLGIGFAGRAAAGPAADRPDRTIAAIIAARAALVAEGGAVVIEDAPAELRAALDSWGPPPAAFPIMERLKQRFDPERRLNPGRFVGGL
ncbi:MAG TPA: hypothetical protein VH165_18990, partial [Kofleriaceae bacterium]|nr:hypothetical protein [Kofleriaceae bacterium]